MPVERDKRSITLYVRAGSGKTNRNEAKRTCPVCYFRAKEREVFFMGKVKVVYLGISSGLVF